MPPRFAYWTIIAEGLPTAFRAKEREELMPTFQRLKEKHPDAEMKWFARGKLWDSPEAARPPRRDDRDDRRGITSPDRGRHGRRDGERDRGAGSSRFPASAGPAHGARTPGSREKHDRGEYRSRDWRPGGEHRDPRQTFRDAKKARNQRWREEKFARKQRFADKPFDRGGPSQSPGGDRPSRPPREKPHGDKLRVKPRWEDQSRWGKRPDERPQMRASSDRKGDRTTPPRADWKNRPPREKPHGDALRAKAGGNDRPRRDERKGWRPPEGALRDRQGMSGPPRADWKQRPPREKPHGDRLRAKPHQDDRPRHEKGPDARAAKRQFNDRRGDAPRPPNDDRMVPPPREKPHGDRLREPASRPFAGHGRFERNQRTDEPKTPQVPSSPNREPRPDENPEPSAPPRPNEPAILPPGPPERGASKRNRWRNR